VYGNVEANYTVAGSFVKYLITKFGAAHLWRTFANADFETGYGFTLDELRQDWMLTLARDNVTPQPEWAVHNTFGTTFLFSTACAHYVANTIEDAERLYRNGKKNEGLEKLEGLLAHHPGRNVLNVLLRKRYGQYEYDSMETLYNRYLPTDSSLLRGDAALGSGEVARAQAIYKKIAALDSDNIPPELTLRLRVCSDSSLAYNEHIVHFLARRNFAMLPITLDEEKIYEFSLYDLSWIAAANACAGEGDYQEAESHLSHTSTETILQEDAMSFPFYCRIHVWDLLHLGETKNAAQFIESVRHFIDPDIFEPQFAPLLRFAVWKLRNTREV
jgi:hypothetical protein